jgi:hypothetical protein
MTARFRPYTRYIPRRRGFRGLGDDGDETDASGAFVNLPSADIPFSNPFSTTPTTSSTVGSGAFVNLPSADNARFRPCRQSTGKARKEA